MVTSTKGNIIYALHRDSSNFVYVGKSTRGMLRVHEHGFPLYIKKKENAQRPVGRWVQKGIDTGEGYQFSILQECQSESELNESEQFHIAYFRTIGMNLLNCTDGGEGTSGMKMPPRTPEHRAKISKANRGKIVSLETRMKQSITRKGKKRTPEACAFLYRRKGEKRPLKFVNEMVIKQSSIPRHIHEIGAEMFREWRKSVGINASEAARIMGINPAAVRKFENRGLRAWKKRNDK